MPGTERQHIVDELNPGDPGWRPSQHASLGLLLRLIETVRPQDFESATPSRRFKAFLRCPRLWISGWGAAVGVGVAGGRFLLPAHFSSGGHA